MDNVITMQFICEYTPKKHDGYMMNTVVYYVTCDFVYLRAGQITFKLELERSNYQRIHNQSMILP